MVEDNPALAAAQVRHFYELEQELTSTLARRMNVDLATDPRPTLIAATFLAVMRVAFEGCAHEGGFQTYEVVARVGEVFALASGRSPRLVRRLTAGPRRRSVLIRGVRLSAAGRAGRARAGRSAARPHGSARRRAAAGPATVSPSRLGLDDRGGLDHDDLVELQALGLRRRGDDEPRAGEARRPAARARGPRGQQREQPGHVGVGGDKADRALPRERLPAGVGDGGVHVGDPADPSDPGADRTEVGGVSSGAIGAAGRLAKSMIWRGTR